MSPSPAGMSRLAYYSDFVTIPALIAGLFALCPVGAGEVALGFFAWTISEYVIHRYLFHRVPVFKAGHDSHHEHPSARTGVTSWHSLIVFGLLTLILPAGVLVGLAAGYYGYIGSHHIVHHWRVGPGHPLYALKMRHRMHHRGLEANFGVVTTLWDRVFGTYVPWIPGARR